MLKKFGSHSTPHLRIKSGDPVYLVTRKGEIIEGYQVQDVLLDLVSLDRSPIDGTEKQGFTIEGDLLRPNWCAGKRVIEAACLSKKQAEDLADKVKKHIQEGKSTPVKACTKPKTK